MCSVVGLSAEAVTEPVVANTTTVAARTLARAMGIRIHVAPTATILLTFASFGWLGVASQLMPEARRSWRACAYGFGTRRFTVKIEYYHGSKFGNGAIVAAEFREQMAAKGVTVAVHHIRQVSPTEMAPADLYVFSSPGRFGKPKGSVRRFLRKARLPAGTKYAVLTTEIAPKPNKKTGGLPSDEELSKRQRVISTMNEILQGKGLVEVAGDKVLVTGMKGPLEQDWQQKVASFVARLPILTIQAHAGACSAEL